MFDNTGISWADCLYVISSQEDYTKFKRKSARQDLEALNRYVGMSTYFVTLAPNMRNNWVALKLCKGTPEDHKIVSILNKFKIKADLERRDPALCAELYHHLVCTYLSSPLPPHPPQ